MDFACASFEAMWQYVSTGGHFLALPKSRQAAEGTTSGAPANSPPISMQGIELPDTKQAKIYLGA